MLGQVKRVVRPTDVPDTGLICDLLWADPDKDRSHLSMSNIGLLPWSSKSKDGMDTVSWILDCNICRCKYLKMVDDGGVSFWAGRSQEITGWAENDRGVFLI